MIRTSRENSKLDSSLVNQKLNDFEAIKLIEWSASVFGDRLVMTTSFGIQSAVMLHLVTRLIPHIPVIWIDTGYFPPETYQFAEKLTQKLNLNLKVYQSSMSPGHMEALHGKLWEKNDLESLNLYDYIRKVEPMQQALKELNAQAWLAGLRSNQTTHRQTLGRLVKHRDIYKIHPILHWHSRDIYQYLTTHNLPYHPYFDLGYVTVGDWHSSRPLMADDTNDRDTRFHGIKQECGLHLSQNIPTKPQQLPQRATVHTIEGSNSESQQFSAQDLDILALTAKWCLQEVKSNNIEADNLVKIQLLTETIQELKITLQSIKYSGEFLEEDVEAISNSQEKEYFEAINHSMRSLIPLVDEIINLKLTEDQDLQVESSSMILKMLCEQIVNSLNPLEKL